MHMPVSGLRVVLAGVLLAAVVAPWFPRPSWAAPQPGKLLVTPKIIASQGALLGLPARGRLLTLYGPPQNPSALGIAYPRDGGIPRYYLDLWQVSDGKLLHRWLARGAPLAASEWFDPQVSVGDRVVGYTFHKAVTFWPIKEAKPDSLSMLQISKSGPKIIWRRPIKSDLGPVSLVGRRMAVVRMSGGLAGLFNLRTGRFVAKIRLRLRSKLTVAPGFLGVARGSSISRDKPAFEIWPIKPGTATTNTKEISIIGRTPRLCVAATITARGGAILAGALGHLELVNRRGIVQIRRLIFRRMVRLSGSLLPWSPEILQISPNGRLCLCCVFANAIASGHSGYTQLVLVDARNLEVVWKSAIRPGNQLAVGLWVDDDRFVTSGVNIGTSGTHVVEWKIRR